jgi:hypothetical protein
MAPVVTPLDQPSNYKDSQARLDRQKQHELHQNPTTLYVSALSKQSSLCSSHLILRILQIGNLRFYTTEEQIHDVFSRCANPECEDGGSVKCIIMGLDRHTRYATPAGPTAFTHGAPCRPAPSNLTQHTSFVAQHPVTLRALYSTQSISIARQPPQEQKRATSDESWPQPPLDKHPVFRLYLLDPNVHPGLRRNQGGRRRPHERCDTFFVDYHRLILTVAQVV